ncbi:gudP [Symbiodinium sp. CCMP2592]|nr:gudP [Symbiodinium sp. CCMP2592]
MQGQESAVASADVRRFVHTAAEPGLQCMAWLPAHETFVDARLRIGQDQLELQTLGTGTPPVKICLGYLRSASVASNAQIPYPSGLSINWVDFAVLLEFFDLTEAMELRTECVLLNGDVEAALLCRSLGQLQRFGVPPLEKDLELPTWVAARARAAVATLTSPDILMALKRWRAGSALVAPSSPSLPSRLRTSSEVGASCTGLSLSAFWKDATAGVWEVLNSPALLGIKPDPNLAAGWDAPLPLNGGDRLDGEAELSARWKKVLGDRSPAELTRSELRALFILGHRIPWQYRLALWPTWLHVAEEGSEPLDDGMLCADETCQKQIEKDVPRPDPQNRVLANAAACGRVLSGETAVLWSRIVLRVELAIRALQWNSCKPFPRASASQRSRASLGLLSLT